MAILVYTPLVCNQPIAVPVLAAYSGVLTRFTISLAGFYKLVFPKLSKTTVVSLSRVFTHDVVLKTIVSYSE